jgi:hypothetical protein
MEASSSEHMELTVSHPPIPEERPDGMFCGMLVQLNGMVTDKSRTAGLECSKRRYGSMECSSLV